MRAVDDAWQNLKDSTRREKPVLSLKARRVDGDGRLQKGDERQGAQAMPEHEAQ